MKNQQQISRLNRIQADNIQYHQRLYGILVDISGSMQESYEQIQKNTEQDNQLNQIDNTRLQSVWKLIIKAIQEENLKNDYLFASAFGCSNKVDVIDLGPTFSKYFTQTLRKQFEEKLKDLSNSLDVFRQNDHQDYYELLYQLVEKSGAQSLRSYYTIENLKQDVPAFQVQLIYTEFTKNKESLKKFISQLPTSVQNKPGGSDYLINGFSSALSITTYLFTVGQVDYNFVKEKIQIQLEKLDTLVDYIDLAKKMKNILGQSLLELQKAGFTEDFEEFCQLKQLHEKFQLLNFQSGQFQRQDEKVSKELIQTFWKSNIFKAMIQSHGNQEFTIDISGQQYLNKFTIMSLGKFARLLKNNQIVINNEDEKKMFEELKKISYGRTPMKKCLRLTLNNDYRMYENKFLFIVSDGFSTDGNPIEYAKQLKNQGFMIICFYIATSANIDDSQLYAEALNEWDPGAETMFEMSSEVSNFEYPLRSIGQHTNIKLSETGKSRLFLQGNNPKQIEKFFNYFMKIKVEQDALINLIGKVNIEEYINSSNEFEAQEQEKGSGTCYANAIAAVYSLVMAKIYKREGGYPSFEEIRDKVIQLNYEKNKKKKGGKTFKIAQQTCSQFRLQCREITNLTDIKQSLHQGRPLLARFYLCQDQWYSVDPNQLGFKPFFNKFPKGILQNLPQLSNKKKDGHAVVLHKYTSEYYSFINSWGTAWGDSGFFKVKDLQVLGKMEFMEVFWTKDNLTDMEIQSFKQDAGQKITEFYQTTFSVIGNESYTCPKCKQKSCINEYQGNYYEAKCPKCQQNFNPQSLGHLFVEYLYGRDL